MLINPAKLLKIKRLKTGVYKVADSNGEKSVVKTSEDGMRPAYEGMSASLGLMLNVNIVDTTVFRKEEGFTKQLVESLRHMNNSTSNELAEQLGSRTEYLVMDFIKGKDLDKVETVDDLTMEEISSFAHSIGGIWLLDTVLGYTDRKKENLRFGRVSPFSPHRKIFAIDRAPGVNSFNNDLTPHIVQARLETLLTKDINAIADFECGYIEKFNMKEGQIDKETFRAGFKKGAAEALASLGGLNSGLLNKIFMKMSEGEELPQTFLSVVDNIKLKTDQIMLRLK